MERKRHWEDESRSQDREAERARSSRGLRFQDEYDLDRTRRGSGHGGAREAYHPTWSWGPSEGARAQPPDPRERTARASRRSDERILEDVHDRLAHGYLDASEIEIIVKDGVVTLEGSVRSKHDQRLAEDLVEDVLGVRELDNRLRVTRPVAEPPRL